MLWNTVCHVCKSVAACGPSRAKTGRNAGARLIGEPMERVLCFRRALGDAEFNDSLRIQAAALDLLSLLWFEVCKFPAGLFHRLLLVLVLLLLRLENA